MKSISHHDYIWVCFQITNYIFAGSSFFRLRKSPGWVLLMSPNKSKQRLSSLCVTVLNKLQWLAQFSNMQMATAVSLNITVELHGQHLKFELLVFILESVEKCLERIAYLCSLNINCIIFPGRKELIPIALWSLFLCHTCWLWFEKF